MEMNLEQLKNQFLDRYNPPRNVELALTSGIKAAVQRNVLYSNNLNQQDRNQIVKSWKEELKAIYQKYVNSAIMNDEIYEELIIRLKTNMNNNYADAFNHNKPGYQNGFRISHAQKSISVFLKHLWCMNLIKIPMQCPVDRIILTRVGCSYPDNKWGYINSIDEHREKIKKIKDYCLPQNIAEWELAAF